MVTQEELEKMSPEEIAELQRKNCIFCKLINGEIPSKKVYEDEDVVAILDINPATKGHILIMPHDHFPILPVIPPNVFKKLFTVAKMLEGMQKDAFLMKKSTTFIANGPVAGQQSPHFLFHLIPREDGDSLTNFDIPVVKEKKEDNDALFENLKNNFAIMMKNHFGREGAQQQNMPVQLTPQQMEEKRTKIARMIDENEDVRNLLVNDIEKFKELVSQNNELKEVFFGVDVDALSNNIKSMMQNQLQEPLQEKKEEKKELDAVDYSQLQPETESKTIDESGSGSDEDDGEVSEIVDEESDNSSDDADEESNEEDDSDEEESYDEPSSLEEALSPKKPEIFLGNNPEDQREKVFSYFESKPKAKELFINDLDRFKELMADRPDIQELFDNVNIDKLSARLKEAQDD